MGSSPSIFLCQSVSVQNVQHCSSHELSGSLKALGMVHLHDIFRDLGVTGKALAFLAYAFLDDHSDEESPLGIEIEALKRWLLPRLKELYIPKDDRRDAMNDEQEKIINQRTLRKHSFSDKIKNGIGSEIFHPMKTPIPRVAFVDSELIQIGQIGNPNISLQGVNFIDRNTFMAMGCFTRYEECLYAHVKVHYLPKNSKLLYVSHQWQGVKNTLPDDEENTHYSLITRFLESESGEDVTHLWIDYSCVVQNTNSEKSLSICNQQLDNIHTAIFLCDVFLVLPRIVYISSKKRQANKIVYTDLNRMNHSGWCLFEAVTALLAQCQVFVVFIAGQLCKAQFLEVDGKVCQRTVSSTLIQQGFQENRRKYKTTIRSAEQIFHECSNEVIENWNKALDPADLIEELKPLLEHVLEDGKFQALSLSVNINCGVGKNISGMLPEFSCSSDRSIVTNLLIHVGLFCSRLFNDVCLKNDAEISDLSKRKTSAWDLDLENQGIFPKDLKSIFNGLTRSTASNISQLNLARNPLGFYGMKVFKKYSLSLSCIKVSFSHCGIGQMATRYIAQMLKDASCSLEYLDLSSNNIEGEGCKFLATAIKSNVSLTSINLSNNFLGDSGCQILFDMLCANCTLHTLNLANTGLGNKAGLSLSKFLKTNSTLSQLDASRNNIGTTVVYGLVCALQMNSILVSLDLSFNETRLVNADTKAFWEQLDNKTAASIYFCFDDLSDAFCRIIQNEKVLTRNFNPTIYSLDLKNFTFTKALGKILGEGFNACPTLTELDFTKKSIGNQASIYLGEALKVNTTLTKLNLEGNGLEDTGGKTVFDALLSNSTLTCLSLANNALSSRYLGESLINILSTNTSLTSLNLENNRLGGGWNMQIGEILGEGLINNVTLAVLNVSNCQLFDCHGKGIAQALKINLGLTSLNLSDNRLYDDTCAAFEISLPSNTALKFLNMQGNELIRDKGACMLAEGLLSNSSVTWLDLSSCALGGDAAEALGKILCVNNSIQVLNLRRNERFGNTMCLNLAGALAVNTSLTSLDLYCCGVKEEGVHALVEGLQCNHSLVVLNLNKNDNLNELNTQVIKLCMQQRRNAKFIFGSTEDEDEVPPNHSFGFECPQLHVTHNNYV